MPDLTTKDALLEKLVEQSALLKENLATVDVTDEYTFTVTSENANVTYKEVIKFGKIIAILLQFKTTAIVSAGSNVVVSFTGAKPKMFLMCGGGTYGTTYIAAWALSTKEIKARPFSNLSANSTFEVTVLYISE